MHASLVAYNPRPGWSEMDRHSGAFGGIFCICWTNSDKQIFSYLSLMSNPKFRFSENSLWHPVFGQNRFVNCYANSRAVRNTTTG